MIQTAGKISKGAVAPKPARTAEAVEKTAPKAKRTPVNDELDQLLEEFQTDVPRKR